MAGHLVRSGRTYIGGPRGDGMLKACAVVAAAAALAALPALSWAAEAPAEPDPSETFNVLGAGASFPFPLIDKWRVEYKDLYGNVNLNYQSIGSGGGIKQHIEKTVNFAASDKPLGSEAAQAPGTLHIPEAIGGVVVAYNLPEMPSSGLRLTGPVLADMFMEKIPSWNDPRIAELNPGVALPDEPIVTVHRSDGSGTTFVFTDYLSAVSAEFERDVGKGKSVPWPGGLGGKGNEGVTANVLNTEYSVGYIELAYAFQNDASYASMQNGDGTAFVEPTLGTLSAASAGAAGSLPPAHCDWSAVSIVNAPGPDSYPLASFTYLLVYEDIEKAVSSEPLAGATIHLLHWMITDGQQFSPGLLYVPIPDNVVEIGRQGLARVSYEGRTVFEYDGARDMQCPSGAGGPAGAEPAQGGPAGSGAAPESGGCLVATAAHGTELAPQVQALREVRDSVVLSTGSGAAFMSAFNQAYYAVSPAVADLERQSPELRELARILMQPMLWSLGAMGSAEPGSELQVAGIGSLVIFANAAMYVGLPAAAAAAARRALG